MRMEPHIGRLDRQPRGVGARSWDRAATRGSAGFAGRLVLTHSGGSLELEDLGSLKLNARNSRGTVKNVSGALALDCDRRRPGADRDRRTARDRGAEHRPQDRRRSRTSRRRSGSTARAARSSSRGLRTEARLDGRNSVIEVDARRAGAGHDLQPRRHPRDRAAGRLHARRGGHRRAHHHGRRRPQAVRRTTTRTSPGPVRGGGPTLTLRAHARQHHACENLRAITQVYICAEFTVRSCTVPASRPTSLPCSPPPLSSRRPSPI